MGKYQDPVAPQAIQRVTEFECFRNIQWRGDWIRLDGLAAELKEEVYNMRKLYSIVLGLLFCAGIVHAQVVEDGLVSYWTFNEDTVEGNTVRDTRGQSHGEFEGNPQIVPGKFDEGLELDGNSRVRIV